MNLLDVKIAMDDLIEHHDVKPNENVYVEGTHGGELINGFDVVETNNFTGVFVLDSRGKPAVSSRVVKELERKMAEILEQNKRYREVIEETKNIIEEAIVSLDNNEKVQGLEWAVKRIDEALESDEN